MTLLEEIKSMKEEKDVLILAHYYTTGDIQSIADAVGDSYLLSKKAAESEAKTILFCGVEFMGESAVILSPEKQVLMPDLSADCPMAHMVTPEDVQKMREEHPEAAVVCYINSTAEIKACADVCVTSSNAERVVRGLPHEAVYFIPDANLGRHIAERIPEKKFYFHDGYCPIHATITPERVAETKAAHPGAKVLMHPECVEAALEMADYIGSTSGIIDFPEKDGGEELAETKAAHPGAKVLMHPECVEAALEMADYIGSTSGIIDFPEKDGGEEYIIATEEGVLYELNRRYPDKHFYMAVDHCICHDMKKNTLEKVYEVLKSLNQPVKMQEEMRLKAEHSLKEMHRLASLEA